MLDRLLGGLSDREHGSHSPRASRPTRRGRRPELENLESRQLLVASLAAIPDITVPNYLGYQVPLDGSAAGAPQTFTVTSSNPNIPVSIASGQFLTLHIVHTPSSPSDVPIDGDVTFQLFQDLTPNTVHEIETFVNDGFYVGKIFHRVANGFPGPTDYIVQGGSASGNGSGNSGQPGTPFPDELNQQLAFTGQDQVAMANAGPDTNDTQFFFTTASPEQLNFAFTIFGQIVSGQDTVVKKMTEVTLGGAQGTTPVNPITITSATLSSGNPNGVVHVDATHANAGESAVVTVTASDPSSHTTKQRSFKVSVVPDTQTERPFVNSLPNFAIGMNQVARFQIPAVSATPALQLGYTIQGGFNAATDAFTPVQNVQSATVDQNTGIVRIVPKANFSGTISLLYGVRDASLPDIPSSYQWHTVTMTVNGSSTPVQQRPIAVQFAQSVLPGTPTTIQLAADNTNPGTQPTFTYTIVNQPLRGTITNFNSSTGRLTYTPPKGYTGPDVFQYTVTATGGGQPTSTSLPSYVNITVAPPPPVTGDTAAVNVIGGVLVVTPPPRTSGSNTMEITQSNSATNPVLEVTINGLLDQNEPAVSSINRIVVYGAKASDSITIDPSVTVPNVTLDGGHGGRNVLNAGATPTVMHGWFGFNTMNGGAGLNKMIGRLGHVKFHPSKATALMYAGIPHLRTSKGFPRPPGGIIYRVIRGHVVPVRRV